ncbi:MAG: hypothetical protein KME29_04865 [Calothrix sp. FI2-JRJ7]|jgi:post-segregation antitoxin (ccd killing protein)|nr:hypothetical protein [Calothrix sp. FI2-JRJ7]
MKLSSKEHLYRTSINVPLELGGELLKACKETGLSVTAFCIIAIDEAIKKHKQERLAKLELSERIKTLESTEKQLEIEGALAA